MIIIYIYMYMMYICMYVCMYVRMYVCMHHYMFIIYTLYCYISVQERIDSENFVLQ